MQGARASHTPGLGVELLTHAYQKGVDNLFPDARVLPSRLAHLAHLHTSSAQHSCLHTRLHTHLPACRIDTRWLALITHSPGVGNALLLPTYTPLTSQDTGLAYVLNSYAHHQTFKACPSSPHAHLHARLHAHCASNLPKITSKLTPQH